MYPPPPYMNPAAFYYPPFGQIPPHQPFNPYAIPISKEAKAANKLKEGGKSKINQTFDLLRKTSYNQTFNPLNNLPLNKSAIERRVSDKLI